MKTLPVKRARHGVKIHLDLLVLKERLQTDTHTINRADWLICSRVLETAG